MVSDQDVDDALEDLIDGTGRSMEWAREAYDEKKDEVQSTALEDFNEQELHDHTIAKIRSDRIYEDRMAGGSGVNMELEILSIGQSGVMDDWGEDDDTVVYSYGFIYGPLGEDGSGKAARAVFVNNKEKADMDLLEVQRKFYAGNTMTAEYSVDESESLNGVYECFSVPATDLEEGELDHLPVERQKKVDILRQATPEASLATLEDDLTKTDPESGFNYSYGADLRRLEASVVHYYMADDNSWGKYTVIDDSVTEDDIVGTDIVNDNANVPGLTVWAEPDYHMEYGRQTRADFYGTIEYDEEKGYFMNLVGIVPIIPTEMDDGEEESASKQVSGTESSI